MIKYIESLRDKEELKDYLISQGLNASEEIIANLKKQYESRQLNQSKLSLSQLDDIAGGSCLAFVECENGPYRVKVLKHGKETDIKHMSERQEKIINFLGDNWFSMWLCGLNGEKCNMDDLNLLNEKHYEAMNNVFANKCHTNEEAAQLVTGIANNAMDLFSNRIAKVGLDHSIIQYMQKNSEMLEQGDKSHLETFNRFAYSFGHCLSYFYNHNLEESLKEEGFKAGIEINSETLTNKNTLLYNFMRGFRDNCETNQEKDSVDKEIDAVCGVEARTEFDWLGANQSISYMGLHKKYDMFELPNLTQGRQMVTV